MDNLMTGAFLTANNKIPPQNIDAERALLGSIMTRPDVICDVVDVVSGKSFYSDRHKIIYETMLELFSKSQPIDLLSMPSRLKEKELLERAGGNLYLTELLGSVPSAANAKHYAEIVQRKFMMRQLIMAAQKITSLGYDEAQDMAEVLD